ncbi:MAG: acyl-CoA desaturase [Bacteroidetes bacterium]|nr:acyl-CoA desaturase [Bacteroidota bacterium]
MSTTPLIRFIDKDKNKIQFYSTLRKRVDSYFKDNNMSKHYNAEMVIKTITLLVGYFLPFACILFFTPSSMGLNLLLWSIMGLALAGIGMSVMHDANHGAYSSSSAVNYWLGNTLNLLGGSVFNWKMQHNMLHHTYTNVAGYDEDIEDKLIMRFSPHTKQKWYNNFQFIHAFFFYGITSIYWTLLKDFVQFYRYKKRGLNEYSNAENAAIFTKIVLVKIVYFFVFIFTPIYFFNVPASYLIIGFLLMHFIAGVILTVVFQLAHTVDQTTHPLPDESGTIENNWAVHQMNTTVDFSRSNKLISWYVGGLNFQVEHHLFPTICHVHYPEVSKIVEATAKEFGVPFLENETLLDALASHVRALKKFGRLPKLSEAIV